MKEIVKRANELGWILKQPPDTEETRVLSYVDVETEMMTFYNELPTSTWKIAIVDGKLNSLDNNNRHKTKYVQYYMWFDRPHPGVYYRSYVYKSLITGKVYATYNPKHTKFLEMDNLPTSEELLSIVKIYQENLDKKNTQSQSKIREPRDIIKAHLVNKGYHISYKLKCINIHMLKSQVYVILKPGKSDTHFDICVSSVETFSVESVSIRQIDIIDPLSFDQLDTLIENVENIGDILSGTSLNKQLGVSNEDNSSH